MKFHIKGGSASPGAQLAPLSSKGIKAIDICKKFNEQTKNQTDTLFRLEVLQFADKTYKIHIRSTPVSKLLLQMADLSKGSSEPNRNKVANLTIDQIKKIAALKQPDTTAFELEPAIRTIQGTARSMGITVN
jgi:large subunit ribosomal protein L11